MSKLLLAVIIGLFLTGCTQDRYQIAMKIRDQDTVRTMKAQRATNREASFDDEVGPAKALYARVIESKAGQSLHLEGEFGLETPDDMGNSGRVSRVRSNLGQVIIYTERFRGTHDLVGLSERQRSACDTFVDVVVAWARKEFAAKPGGAELIQVIDTDVRRDVQNLAMLAWLASVNLTAGSFSDDPDAGNKLMTEFGARALALLVERHYIAPEASELWKYFFSIGGQPEKVAHLTLQAIGRKLVAEGNPKAADLLKPTGALSKSFLKFAWDHPELIRPWFERHDLQSPIEAHNDWERDIELPTACEQLLFESVGVMTGARDDLALSIIYEGECLSTNGIKKGPDRIEWTFSIERARSMGVTPPAVAMATIASPDKKAQELLFGEVRLKGSRLAQYSIGFAALTPEQRATWLEILRVHHTDAERLESELEQTGIHYQIAAQLMIALKSDDVTEE